MQGLELVQRMVWGPGLLFLFLGTGVVCTCRLKGFQLLKFRSWWRETAGRIGENGNRGQFKTACTALAATVGTGNIAGVATALSLGGPGAVFWMWISAFLGMATAYAEVFLGIRYRKLEHGSDGEWIFCVGPFAYLERGLHWNKMAGCYACFTVLTSLGMGSMVQAASLAESVCYTARISETAVGLILVCLTGAVILGGIRRISSLAELLVPVSAGAYLFLGGIAVLSCYRQIPWALQAIFSQAFTLKSAAGGAAGYGAVQAIRFGVARGVFSNEAGLGSLALLHGSAEKAAEAENQGMWAIFEVFFDTVVCCSLTALILLCVGEAGEGSKAVAACFSRVFGGFGAWFTAASMALFAFATILAWYYLGQQAVGYLCRRLACREKCFTCYTVFYLTAVFSGCVMRLTSVWLLSDIFNGLMAIPNLLAILCLQKEVRIPKRK